MRRPSLEKAKAQFVQRYTCEHVPAWARRPCEGNGKYYAPQFATDAEWYANTLFKGERGHHGEPNYCHTANQTWPLGQWLDSPFEASNHG